MRNEDDFVFESFCGTHELQRQIEEIMRQAEVAMCCALIIFAILIAAVTVYLICRHYKKKAKSGSEKNINSDNEGGRTS